jgi:hypothetical protein
MRKVWVVLTLAVVVWMVTASSTQAQEEKEIVVAMTLCLTGRFAQACTCFEHSEFDHLILFRIGPFGMLRPNFACLRRSGFAE